MEVKKLVVQRETPANIAGGKLRTFTVPSNVLTITTALSASVATPVMHRSLDFFFEDEDVEVLSLPAASGGHAPTLNVFRSMPDCMLYICTAPVDDVVRPKLPHADTQTDCSRTC